MSAPPPYSSPVNPDRRQLPPGWVTQFDNNYKTWFYVNTQAQPPVTTWVHPLGPPSSTPPPPNAYGPPAGPPPPGPPPPDRGYGSGPGYGYNNPQGQYSGYGPGPGYQSGPPQGYYGSPPPQQYGGGYQAGYAPQENRGMFGFGRPQQQYPPQQNVAYEQAPPKKSGPGMGTMLAVGGAGLLGGALLGEAIEHHEDEERFDAYQDGYEQGQMNDDYGGGDDFGGDF